MTAEFTRADRIRGLEGPEIVQISDRAAALKAADRDVVSLSTKEPDLPTRDHLTDAAHQAALQGQTRCTALGSAAPRWLLIDHGVAQVAGRAFGLPGHLRLGFARSDAVLTRGLARLSAAPGAR